MFKQGKGIALGIILSLIIAIYIFSHQTPERTIRTSLFFHGYFTDALETEIYISNTAPWKGKYYCKNPVIGPDFIEVKKGFLGLWNIDYQNSGGA